jgi:NAD(P)-dependent dehydrogenase (short-subunit alcohol dehydrogenase family)
MRLKHRVAVVTGGGRGIGRAIAVAYAREGADISIADIDQATANQTADAVASAGGRAIVITTDVARKQDATRLVDETVRAFGRVDIVVNNAMKMMPGKLEELTEDDWDTTMNVGLRGAFLVSQAAARHMIVQQTGCFVNIASAAGLFPYNLVGAYSVAKAGLLMLTKLQAIEWGPYGIRANAITPGYIRTPATEAMYSNPDVLEARRKGLPLGRMGEYDDVTGVALFLASDDARYTTGSVVGADGGQAVGYYLTVPGRRQPAP